MRELGIVKPVHTFVTKVFGKFINPFKTAHDQAFQIEFIGNAQIKRNVQGVVVRNKRPGGGTTRNSLQNGRLHFQVSFIIQEIAHRFDDLCPFDKGVFYFIVNDQVDITLPVTLVGVGECIIHFSVFLFHDGQRPQRFRQNRKLFNVYRNFSHFGNEHKSFHANYIPDIEQTFENNIIHRFVFSGTNVITLEIELYPACMVLQFGKSSGSHNPAAHNPAGNADFLKKRVVLREFLQNFGRCGVHLIGCLRIRVDAQFY